MTGRNRRRLFSADKVRTRLMVLWKLWKCISVKRGRRCLWWDCKSLRQVPRRTKGVGSEQKHLVADDGYKERAKGLGWSKEILWLEWFLWFLSLLPTDWWFVLKQIVGINSGDTLHSLLHCQLSLSSLHSYLFFLFLQHSSIHTPPLFIVSDVIIIMKSPIFFPNPHMNDCDESHKSTELIELPDLTTDPDQCYRTTESVWTRNYARTIDRTKLPLRTKSGEFRPEPGSSGCKPMQFGNQSAALWLGKQNLWDWK